MTVGDLVEELKKQPQYLPVKVMLTEIYGTNNEQGQFVDDLKVNLTEQDAIEAEYVRHEGTFILIVSK